MNARGEPATHKESMEAGIQIFNKLRKMKSVPICLCFRHFTDSVKGLQIKQLLLNIQAWRTEYKLVW